MLQWGTLKKAEFDRGWVGGWEVGGGGGWGCDDIPSLLYSSCFCLWIQDLSTPSLYPPPPHPLPTPNPTTLYHTPIPSDTILYTPRVVGQCATASEASNLRMNTRLSPAAYDNAPMLPYRHPDKSKCKGLASNSIAFPPVSSHGRGAGITCLALPSFRPPCLLPCLPTHLPAPNGCVFPYLHRERSLQC